MKEKGMSKTTMATVIVVALVVAGVGAYFLMKPGVEEKPGEEGGEAENQESEMGFEWFQAGNTLSITQLQTKQSSELENNRIGGQWDRLGQYDLSGIIDSEIFGLGLKRVRLAIWGTSWDHIGWNGSELYIDPTSDDLFSKVANNGVAITYVLSFWDKEYVAQGGEVQCPRFKTEEEIQRYLDFVQFIVHHFKDRIKYYEIWNEPDIGVCIQRIEVDDYINLTRRAIPVIRQEYPEAKIIVGATTPFCEPPHARDYFFNILKSDVMPLVDAVSWHCHTSP